MQGHRAIRRDQKSQEANAKSPPLSTHHRSENERVDHRDRQRDAPGRLSMRCDDRFRREKESGRRGGICAAIWFKTLSDGRKYEAIFPHLPIRENNALLIGPLGGEKFEPDIVLLYGTPAQMIFVVNALQWENYERLTFYCSGESSCADYIAGCLLSHKPQLTIPCYGERVYGHAQEEELVMAIPANEIGKVLEGLAGLSKRGVRYPIPYAGPQLDVAAKLPPMYLEVYGIMDRPLFESWNS